MVQLCSYNKLFLELSWTWLSDPEIKQLTQTKSFTKEEQNIWFLDLAKKKDYLIWGIKKDDTPIGVCGLKNINKYDCEYWGYIGEKNYWGKGIGSDVITILLQKSRDLGLKEMWLKVLKSNIRAVRLYVKMNFLIDSVSDDKYLMKRVL